MPSFELFLSRRNILKMNFFLFHFLGPQAATLMRKMGFVGLIIGVTGHAQTIDIENFKKCGANAVLPKPLNFVKMNALVKELLDN